MIEGADGTGAGVPPTNGESAQPSSEASRRRRTRRIPSTSGRRVDDPREASSSDERTMLRLLAQGELIGDIAARTALSPAHIRNLITGFGERYGVPPLPEERPDTYRTRIVFRAISRGLVHLPPAATPTAALPGFVTDYFTALNNNDPVEDRAALNNLAQQAADYVTTHASTLGVNNVIHAASLWRLQQREDQPDDQPPETLGRLTEYQLNALRLKAKGYKDHEIATMLSEQEGHDTPLDEKAITTRLQYSYAKLGVSSNTEAVLTAMETGLITPEFILEGYDNPDHFSELAQYRNGLAIKLLEILIAEGGRAKTYKELGESPEFTNPRQVRRLVDNIRNILGTKDVYHTTMVYAAAKRAGLIRPSSDDQVDV